MEFKLLQTDSCSSARAAKLTTDHGTIETPIFMPVGTAATVKGVHQRELVNDIKPDIIFVFTPWNRNYRKGWRFTQIHELAGTNSY